MKAICSIIILFGTLFSFSQAEKLNQLDANAKKDGKWILYLDAFGAKVDSSKAVYCRYTYYDHGVHIYPMGNFISKGEKIEAKENDAQTAGKIKVLDGEYKCLDKNGKVKYIHVFKNGEYVSYKEFFDSGEIQTFFDYTKHCKGQSHSWYTYIYDKTGKLTYEDCTCKDAEGHWPKMKG